MTPTIWNPALDSHNIFCAISQVNFKFPWQINGNITPSLPLYSLARCWFMCSHQTISLRTSVSKILPPSLPSGFLGYYLAFFQASRGLNWDNLGSLKHSGGLFSVWETPEGVVWPIFEPRSIVKENLNLIFPHIFFSFCCCCSDSEAFSLGPNNKDLFLQCNPR